MPRYQFVCPGGAAALLQPSVVGPGPRGPSTAAQQPIEVPSAGHRRDTCRHVRGEVDKPRACAPRHTGSRTGFEKQCGHAVRLEADPRSAGHMQFADNVDIARSFVVPWAQGRLDVRVSANRCPDESPASPSSAPRFPQHECDRLRSRSMLVRKYYVNTTNGP
jgi:hypothetical protein